MIDPKNKESLENYYLRLSRQKDTIDGLDLAGKTWDDVTAIASVKQLPLALFHKPWHQQNKKEPT